MAILKNKKQKIEQTSETLLYLLFWGCMMSLTGFIVMYFGTEFVDAPKLTAKQETKQGSPL